MKYYAIIGQTGCIHDQSSIPAIPSGHIEMQGPPPSGESVAQEDGAWGYPPLPTPEEVAEMEMKKNKSEATTILIAAMQRTFVQIQDFTEEQNSTFLKAGLFPDWTPGAEYSKGNRIAHDGVVYEAQQSVAAQVHQPPGAEGMLAIYRPISRVNTGSGSGGDDDGNDPTADGSFENPFLFINGMDVQSGSHYLLDGKKYLAKADMIPCVWRPDTSGLWQWELVG